MVRSKTKIYCRGDKAFSEDELARAASCQVIHSSFNDPGADWNRYDLYDQEGNLFASRTVEGF